jgi:hypothetical protein
MGYLIDILIGVISGIVTGELSAHVEPMARWIIGKAVERLPADDRDRFREEWVAHLDEIPGTVRKLGHALGCYIGATAITQVLERQRKRSVTPPSRTRVYTTDWDNWASRVIWSEREYRELLTKHDVAKTQAYFDGFAMKHKKGIGKQVWVITSPPKQPK